MTQMLELTRSNVTPAQFMAYVKYQLRKHDMNDCASDLDLNYWKRGDDLNFDIKYGPDDPQREFCKAEKSVSRPYEMQTYVRNADDSVYNQIMEFTFDDDRIGHGYFFYLNMWD